ncbi:MAG: P-loop containing nucleoside triphosphate hydrolase protein [Monoraphidium minutum]|nr:MAG: P-loop containing nucleoside triphosphate hydrolase protein [Monoraphidium minutum]
MAVPGLSWFPGHMAKATRDLQRVLKRVDCVLEIRDARLPFTSANPDLGRLIAGKRKIIALNKSDLADPNASRAALRRLCGGGGGGGAGGEEPGAASPAALLTCAHQARSVRQLLGAALERLRSERRGHSGMALMMVVGTPNTGKSRLINAMKLVSRSQGALPGEQAFNRTALTGDTPGLTRRVEGFQVCADPEVHVLDMPGVMPQRVASRDDGLRLALAGIVKDSVAREDRVVSFLIEQLRARPRHRRTLEAVAARLAGGGDGEGDDGGDGGGATRAWRPRGGGGGGGGSGGSGGGGGGGGSNAQRRQLLALAEALLAAAGADLPAAAWHPGLDDGGDGSSALSGGGGGEEAARRRLEILLEALGVDPGGRDPSRRAGAYGRVLRAFRGGELGRYTLDDV